MKVSNELFVTPHKDSVEISSDGESIFVTYSTMASLIDALVRIQNTTEEDYLEALEKLAREQGSWEQMIEDDYESPD